MIRTLTVAVPCAVTTLSTDSLAITVLMGLTAVGLLARVLRGLL